MKYLPQFVYGATDGIITTFAIVSAVAGAKMSKFGVIAIGLASLFSDGFSMGISSFLSEESRSDMHNPYMIGLFTFLSFITLGSISLIPFFLFKKDRTAFIVSYIATGITLFLVGAIREYINKGSWIQGGSESLLLGGSASLIAYGVGHLTKSFS